MDTPDGLSIEVTEAPTGGITSTDLPTMEGTTILTESPTVGATEIPILDTPMPTAEETTAVTKGSSTDIPASINTTESPTPANVMETPVPTDAGPDIDSDASNVVIVPSRLSFGFFELAEKRQPEQSEVDALIQQINTFYTGVLAANFTNFAFFEADGESMQIDLRNVPSLLHF